MSHTTNGNSVTNHELESCIRSCLQAESTCQQALAYCMEAGAHPGSAQLMRLLLDCAELSRLNADLLLRASDLQQRQCIVCAEACERCAAACDDYPEDPVLKMAAQVCRRCAESCYRMALAASSA